MSKKASAIILTVVAVVVLAIAVFAFLPVSLKYGEYNQYNSPLTLIQASGLYTDTVSASYDVTLDEDAKVETVVKQIKQRLTDAYGYYGSNVSAKDGVVTVVVPKTANSESTTAETILSNVTTVGKIEVFSSSNSSSSSPTYSSSNVILKPEHFKKATYRRYTNSNQTYCILEVTLNEAGQKAASTMSTSTTYYVARDEQVILAAWKTSENMIQMQVGTMNKSNEAYAKLITSYINSSALVGDLSQNDIKDNNGIGGVIMLAGVAAIIVAGWIVLLAKFKALGIAAIYSQLIAMILFVICAGFIGMQIFNTAAVVGLVCGLALMFFFNYKSFSAINGYLATKTFASSCYKGYKDTDKLNLIVHAIVLVLSIVLWLIPTVVTAPFGNVLCYMTVLSFIATMGLNRLFVRVVAPFVHSAE